MNDQDVERVLRTTLTNRAGTVTNGPAWNAQDDVSTRRTRRRARWLAPLAAAAVILAVVGGVFALRYNDKPPQSTPAAIDQTPIPAGMKAVDTLGVEIFIPAAYSVDTGCGDRAVLRPVPFPGAPPSCPTSRDSIVAISPSKPPAARGCTEQIALGGERACLSDTATASIPSIDTFSVYWPQHRVAISALGRDRAVLLRIIRSAHAVPVDRHGCPAARDPIEAPGQHDPAAVGGAPIVPAQRHASSMSVCWYIAHRLVASAGLGTKDTASVLHAAAVQPTWFSPVGSPGCGAVDRTDAVILGVRYSGGGSAEGIVRLAGCPWRGSAGGQDGFVVILARLAGMPLTLGYPPPR
ncbi:MAG: hypothetical protein ABI808_06370 [Pseudonocardiales bacterium]